MFNNCKKINFLKSRIFSLEATINRKNHAIAYWMSECSKAGKQNEELQASNRELQANYDALKFLAERQLKIVFD